jgi:ATP-dependent Clp protease ATP-binding subunit ClpC
MARSLRVYFVGHATDRVTGILMRAIDRPTDDAPPTAIGDSEEDLFRQLEVLVAELEAKDDGVVERYLWDEELATREVAVEVHPQAAVKRRMVIGKAEIPLRMTFVFAKLAAGGYRVMLPRFGWWFVLEELALAQEVLAGALGAALLGATGKSVYDFRREGDEWVREWNPRFLRRDARDAKDDDDTPRPTLDAVAEELVDKASRGKLAPVVGDWPDIAPALPLFDRDPLPSILLVGGAGVGKSTWVRRLARAFAQRKRDAGGRGDEHVPRIWSTSGDRLLAGMVYLGMWQKRCLDLVHELAHEGDYLYVDRLVSIAHAQPDGGSIAEILLPAMLAEEISVIAECSEEELERCQRRAASLVGAFRIVRVDEPSPSRMPALLDLYAKRHDNVVLHPSSLQRAVHHLATFQRDLRFPGKAFRFVDWLEQSRASTIAKGAERRPLYPSDVSDAFSRWSGLPIDLVSDDRAVSHADLAAQLRRGVIGQDHACELAAKVLARLKAGLNDPEKPCGTLMFVGPTGVGKTELAKQLAAYLFGDPKRMIRLDMSEYMLGGAAQRLLAIGDGGRSLAEQVRAQPLSLVLLDEIEKAHPEVFDLLLGVLGEGRLTDELGRLVDFRMTVIVMTSNLGSADAAPVGFDAEAPRGYERAVRDHFRPELFNRIDHVVSFQRLSRESVAKIVDLALGETRLRTGLVRRRLRLEVHPEARERLAQLGWNPLRGARPLKRAIEEHVVAPIAALLAREPKLRDATIVLGRDLSVEVRASRSS